VLVFCDIQKLKYSITSLFYWCTELEDEVTYGLDTQRDLFIVQRAVGEAIKIRICVA